VETGARRGGNWNEEGWKLERGGVETGARRGGNWSEEGWKQVTNICTYFSVLYFSAFFIKYVPIF
jgi:hypothetical protein